jgi:Fe-S cluster biogenesis protein NfuA
MSYAIITAPTPNPNALKFLLNIDVKTDGKVTFKSKDEAKGLDLVDTLFSLVFVQQVHLFENVVTITKTEHPTDWDACIPMIKSVLNSRLPNHNPDFKDEELGVVTHDRSSKSPEVQAIEEVLDRTVRSYLQGDGGDIDVVDYKNNTVLVNYVGACGTCPSSAAGTLNAIQSTLRAEVNPEISVVAVNNEY